MSGSWPSSSKLFHPPSFLCRVSVAVLGRGLRPVLLLSQVLVLSEENLLLLLSLLKRNDEVLWHAQASSWLVVPHQCVLAVTKLPQEPAFLKSPVERACKERNGRCNFFSCSLQRCSSG